MKKDYYMYIFLGVCAFLSLLLLIFLGFETSLTTFTALETVVFSISLSIFTTSVSLMFSMVQANRNLEEQLQLYGKLAMRRVIQSIKGCNRLLSTIQNKENSAKEKGFNNKEESNEFLDNIKTQTYGLKNTILDSKEDWRDILRDVRERADEIDKEFTESVFQYQEIQKELQATKEQLKQATVNRPQLEKKLKDLEEENARIREKLIEKEKKISELSSYWPLSSTTVSSSSLSSVSPYYTGTTDLSSWIITPDDTSTFFYGTCGDCGKSIESDLSRKCSLCGKVLCLDCSGGVGGLQAPSVILCKACKEKK